MTDHLSSEYDFEVGRGTLDSPGDNESSLSSPEDSSKNALDEAIHVCVRVRPLPRSLEGDNVGAWEWDSQRVRQTRFRAGNSTVSRRTSIMSARTDDSRRSSMSLAPPARSARSSVSTVNSLADESSWRTYDPLQDSAASTPYNFHHVFTPENTNSDIYENVVKRVVSKVILGQHGSVFTYGQTASG
jgi:hypothetical protein